MSTWYQKVFPRIKDVKPYISKISEDIKKIDGVKKIYLWGSCHKNFDNPTFRVKDVDIIVKTFFNSGDLLSIDETILSKNYKDEYLEEQGYHPAAIKFSKQYKNITKNNVDRWAISSDKKLLHWGPILMSKEESDEVKKEAEQFAKKETGYNRSKIIKSSQKIKDKWYNSHEHYLGKYLSGMPSGWYKSSEEDIKNILKNTREL